MRTERIRRPSRCTEISEAPLDKRNMPLEAVSQPFRVRDMVVLHSFFHRFYVFFIDFKSLFPFKRQWSKRF